MLIYHYAAKPFRTLLTLRQQGVKENIADPSGPHPYIDHISFFVDPVPVEIMGFLFSGMDHRVWRAGNTLYQHVVDTRRIGPFDYMLVETPLDYRFMDERWPADIELSKTEREKYFADLYKEKRQQGLIGSGALELEKAASSFVGGTRTAFINRSRVNDESEMKRYATGVPHVLVYPRGGKVVTIATPEPVKIGNSRPHSGTENIPTSTSTESLPCSARW